jgi:hypothetical protein
LLLIVVFVLIGRLFAQVTAKLEFREMRLASAPEWCAEDGTRVNVQESAHGLTGLMVGLNIAFTLIDGLSESHH